MANEDIKRVLRKKGLKQWQLADFLKMREETLCRELRHELSSEQKAKLLEAMEIMKAEQ